MPLTVTPLDRTLPEAVTPASTEVLPMGVAVVPDESDEFAELVEPATGAATVACCESTIGAEVVDAVVLAPADDEAVEAWEEFGEGSVDLMVWLWLPCRVSVPGLFAAMLAISPGWAR